MAATETSARANAVLDELYREHVGDVYRYTYAVLGNHADAEDVTQTTFVNALRALERGETPEDPSRWLTVIAHNLVRQRWRQAAARPTLVELETDVADAEEADEGFELDELVRALQRIPETQREAIVMRELEGRSYREIATVMGLSTSALETLLFRARRSLAEELENVVTCQNAELALSKRLDGRLSRKERRRLDEHLADCPDCARLAATQQRQRRAFKGLALLPLPIGLALFKGAPSAAAATSVPAIGLGTAATGSSGAAGAGATGATSGGAAVGGSLAGGVVLKVAAVVVTAAVAAGVGYKGVQSVRQTPAETPKADVKQSTHTGAPRAAATPRVALAAPVKKTPVEAKEHGKPASSPSRAKHDVAATPALAARSGPTASQSAPAASNADNASAAAVGTGATPHPAGATGPKHVGAPAKSSAPAAGAKGPAAPKGGAGTGAQTGAPATPKAPKTPSAGGAGGGNANGGAASGNPAGGNPTGGAQPAPAPGGTTAPAAGGAPATGGAPTGSPSQPADPVTVTTPPTTDPVTQPPTQETPPSTPPSTGTTDPPSGSTGDTSGDDGSSGNNGSNGADNGEKNGHHKGNHDGRHPEDS